MGAIDRLREAAAVPADDVTVRRGDLEAMLDGLATIRALAEEGDEAAYEGDVKAMSRGYGYILNALTIKEGQP
jgi:hypothetical protein